MRTSSINSSRKTCASITKEDEARRRNRGYSSGKINIVGIGPGALEHMTPRARQAIEDADVIIGYATYTKLIQSIIKPGAEVTEGTMGREVERAKEAIKKAQTGKSVAVISSGDPGVYGMAGVILEAAALTGSDVLIDVIPGVTAATAAASKLGAPLVSDFAVISLSDLLTPLYVIERRLNAAAQADFAIVLYNPQSMGRKQPLIRAHQILLEHKNPNTPVGVVKQAGRTYEETTLTTLKDMLNCNIDMVTTLIIGTSTTQVINGKMVTSRGYNLTR